MALVFFRNMPVSVNIDVKTKSGICTNTTIFLTILVVIGHITRMYTDVGIFSSEMERDDTMAYITKLLYSFHMPSFMAVSGAVFSLCINDLGKYTDARKFVANKVVRLLIPYFVFLLLFVNPVLFYIGKLHSDLGSLLVNNIMFMGDTRHLWFLPVLFGCLVIMYACRKYINKYPKYILIVVLALWAVSGKAYSVHPVLSAVLYYLIFFYIGYLLLRYIGKLSFINSSWFIICSLIPLMMLCPYTGNIGVKFVLNIIGIFFSFGCGWWLTKRIMPNRVTNILSRDSFGIYLFHPLLIYLVFYYLIFFDISINHSILVSMLIVIVLICSILLTEGMRFLRLYGAIGESSNVTTLVSRVYTVGGETEPHSKSGRKRNSSVELLRIVAITFVLILHTRFDGILSVYDGGLTLSHICRFAFEAFAIVGVNVFIMISGYFGIKLSGRSIARYCFQVYYFAFIALLLLWLIGDTPIDKAHILKFLFPVSHNVWFVPCYFILMLLAPVLNSFIAKVSLRNLIVYTAMIYVVSYVWSNVFQTISGFGGYGWGFFIVLYLLGAIVGKWNNSHATSKALALGGYVFCSLLIVGIAVVQIRFDFGRSLLWSYDSPLVIASSVCLFLFFSNLKMKYNRLINFIAGSTFAVLLFHMSSGSHYFDLHRQIFSTMSGVQVILCSALVVIVYFIAAVLLDQPRKYIFNHFFPNRKGKYSEAISKSGGACGDEKA